MSVITKVNERKTIFNRKVKVGSSENYFTTLWTKYMDYAENQERTRIFWYMKSIMVIPCAVMVPFIFLMAMATPNYVWFVGLCVLLFFANMVVHIAELPGRLFVPVYQVSIAVMVLIPMITYLINL